MTPWAFPRATASDYWADCRATAASSPTPTGGGGSCRLLPDLELTWPLPSHYARGAYVPAVNPRLIRRPDDTSPYTPPIPLYLMACQLTGTAPLWTAGVGGARSA